MYENIGGKIKILAKIAFIVEAICAVITGLFLLATNDDSILAGVLTLFCGPVVAFVSTWTLYAFGEITEDIGLMRQKYVGDKVNEQKKNKTTAAPQTPEGPIVKELNATEQAEIRDKWDHWDEEDTSIGKCDVCGTKGQFLVYAEYQIGDSTRQNNICFKCFSHRECKPVTRN